MNVFKEYLNRNSRFFEIDPEETKVVTFIDVEPTTIVFKGKKVDGFRVTLEEGGVRKFWDRASRSLAKQMAAVPKGSLMRVTRKGLGNQTTYLIEVLKGGGDEK